jgi:hypothetical protein
MESQETNNESMPVENSMEVSSSSTTTAMEDSTNEPTAPEISESTSSSPSMNMENTMNTNNMDVGDVGSSTITTDENNNMSSETTLEDKSNSINNNEVTMLAKSPAAEGRSNKQRKSDQNAAEMLERMRNMWNREFADIPEKSRPKPPSWGARAAMYKTGAEQEEYLQNLIRESRNSLMAKNSSDYNRGLGNNTEILVEQLVSGLDNLTKIARQLKNVTRKGKSGRANNSSMNMGNSNSSMNMGNSNSSMNMGSNYNMNRKGTYNNSNNNISTRRVSPLTKSKSTLQSRKKFSKKPNSMFNDPSLNF